MSDSSLDPIRVAERVLLLLETGAFTSTYKQAVLVALLDLCLERRHQQERAPESVTTRQLAEKVLELYWPQIRPWGEGGAPLDQSNNGKSGRGGAKIIRLVHAFRQAVQSDSRAPSLYAARLAEPERTQALVQEIEWILIKMPLPKLQRVGGEDTHWLYRIAWNDGARCPTQAEIRKYQQGERTSFDNLIRFQPGVAESLAKLHGILRPFILQHWSAKVAALNHLDEGQLSNFLFGVERAALTKLREPLRDLQEGDCFYCHTKLSAQGAELDHFIPWSRHPDNGLHNLVLAHSRCNNSKRDFLASERHLQSWRRRSMEKQRLLTQIASHHAWDLGEERIIGVARSIYLGLPTDARLWSAPKIFSILDAQRVRSALHGR